MWEGEIRVELSEELTCVRCELLGEKRVSRRGDSSEEEAGISFGCVVTGASVCVRSEFVLHR